MGGQSDQNFIGEISRDKIMGPKIIAILILEWKKKLLLKLIAPQALTVGRQNHFAPLS